MTTPTTKDLPLAHLAAQSIADNCMTAYRLEQSEIGEHTAAVLRDQARDHLAHLARLFGAELIGGEV